jgi:hypothetical protein
VPDVGELIPGRSWTHSSGLSSVVSDVFGWLVECKTVEIGRVAVGKPKSPHSWGSQVSEKSDSRIHFLTAG